VSANQNKSTPTIARIWRGRTRSKDSDAYAVYMADAGLRDMEKHGALGVQMFRENQGDSTEFMAITYWESFETMAAWAGDDPLQVRHLPCDSEFLIEMPERVQVLEIVENTWR
jgi:heme-degrading monooxygenase HmoA